MRNYAPLRVRIIFRAFACEKEGAYIYASLISRNGGRKKDRERVRRERRKKNRTDNYTRARNIVNQRLEKRKSDDFHRDAFVKAAVVDG